MAPDNRSVVALEFTQTLLAEANRQRFSWQQAPSIRQGFLFSLASFLWHRLNAARPLPRRQLEPSSWSALVVLGP
jgi:hypothetical protein